ncbi:MAG: hypothetical protein ACK5H2_08965 [Beutenbergiaceae bacterium]
MNDEDELIARVRAADPSVGRTADLDSLRRSVAARVADSDGAGAAVEGTEGGVDELAARRARSTRRWAPLSAAAAAALVFGVGGFLAGQSGVGGSGDLAESEDLADAQPEVSPGPDLSGADGEEQAAAAADSGALELQPSEDTGGAGPVRFVAVGLEGSDGVAQVFVLDPAVADADEATRLAAAVGVVGDPLDEGTRWRVYGDDGSSVQLIDDGATSFGYDDPAVAPQHRCAGAEDVDTCLQSLPVPPEPSQLAREFLQSLGVDVGELTFRVVSQADGAAVVTANAGLLAPSVATWTFGVAADGVYSATGPLAPSVSLGDYPIVSAADAVSRLMDSRFASASAPMGTSATAAVPQELPTAGDRLSWPVTEVEITDAELGLAGYHLADGSVALLPTWRLLEGATGSEWLVLAVAEESLEFVAS